MARDLVNEFDEQIGHVEVDKVIFVRVVGSTAKWLGKCFPIKIPFNIIPMFMINCFKDLGIVDERSVADIPEELYDIRYIIALNNDKIEESAEGPVLSRIEQITLLHELAHIGPDMEGTEKHDCEDFKFVLDKFGTHWDEGILNDFEEESIQDVIEDIKPPVI
jgi:hypothetical protein